MLERGARGSAGQRRGGEREDRQGLWKRDSAEPHGVPPLLDDDRLYFGSENGTVYALRASDGAARWTFKASGAVKGGPALANGKLYFGDYKGRVYAIRQADGRQLWAKGTSGARLGLSSGQFYSTPAVAYGRVYIGNTDGKMYSYARPTASSPGARAPTATCTPPPPSPRCPAASRRSTSAPTAARSTRWTRAAARSAGATTPSGKISGGATVIGDIVYFANLGKKDTIGLGARTGRKVFRFPRGSFNPVVSDGRMIYLTGYSSLYGLRPKTR